jgi:shikimate dehydrogenase
MQPSNLQTFKLGLIGYPLSHSLSPRIHTAALQSCGLEGDYSLFPIPPNDRPGLKDLLSRLRSGEFHGLNVTIPHKQNVIPFLDILTPTAGSIGAVNTIYVRNAKLIGDNTDAPGFLADLKLLIDSSAFNFQPSALVLGAGGSARAVVYALLNDGWNVILAARRMEQANELAKQFEAIKIIEFNLQTFRLSNFQLIVNTTPLGMSPNIDQSPWPEDLSFPKDAAIYDLVYNPGETKLVRDARLQRLQATTGLGMLLEQAALAFEIWTSCNLSREVLRASLEQSLISNI